LCIPEIPEEDFIQAVKELVALDADWVPSAPNTSLYIRPCTIATDPFVGVRPSATYRFFIICSPSGPYYAEGLNPVRIYVEDELTRAAPGGTGSIKCGGNYAASLFGQMKADKLGFSQVLWLDGVERKYVEEVGSMNCFFMINGEIFTAPAGETVLPGITRMSCIELLRGWGYTVREERVAIDDIMAAARSGKLQEVFGTGTAAVVSPVGALCYKGEEVTLADGKTIGSVTQKLYDTLTGIQWGRVADEKGWIVAV
jgi:branched-chain amino acid aminotransferase